MSDKKLNDTNIGMIITVYHSWGKPAAVRYIKQAFSFSDDKANEIIEEIIRSDRSVEYKKHIDFERRMSEYRRNEQLYEKINDSHSIAKNSNKYSLKRESAVPEYKEQEVRREKKKNTMVFIDAESVSADKCPGIVGQSKSAGEIFEIRYYARQKDTSTMAWKEMARHYGIKAILIPGEPEKNKIDNKIIKDIKHILDTNKSIDVFCIASRDGDYMPIVEYIQQHKKRAIVLAAKNTSGKLKDSASEVRGI